MVMILYQIAIKKGSKIIVTEKKIKKSKRNFIYLYKKYKKIIS